MKKGKGFIRFSKYGGVTWGQVDRVLSYIDKIFISNNIQYCINDGAKYFFINDNLIEKCSKQKLEQLKQYIMPS